MVRLMIFFPTQRNGHLVFESRQKVGHLYWRLVWRSHLMPFQPEEKEKRELDDLVAKPRLVRHSLSKSISTHFLS